MDNSLGLYEAATDYGKKEWKSPRCKDKYPFSDYKTDITGNVDNLRHLISSPDYVGSQME